MERGDRVPDSLIMEIMEAKLQKPDFQKGFLLDGFPRTIPQSEDLKKLPEKLGMKLDLSANLEVPKDVILDCLATRQTCSNPDCQEICNVKSKPPSPEGKCLRCGSPVVQRADETEKAIAKRLDTYHEKTAPH